MGGTSLPAPFPLCIPVFEEWLTLGGLYMKPRSPPAMAPAVTSVSNSSRPAALQPQWQGLVFTWEHITVSAVSGLETRERLAQGRG